MDTSTTGEFPWRWPDPYGIRRHVTVARDELERSDFVSRGLSVLRGKAPDLNPRCALGKEGNPAPTQYLIPWIGNLPSVAAFFAFFARHSRQLIRAAESGAGTPARSTEAGKQVIAP
jgi:hypothetical protein